MRTKKFLSIVLCLCMLVGLCQFSLSVSAESTVTMAVTEFPTGVQTINCTITSDATNWWAAVYPASQTAYGGSNPVYADYIAYGDYQDPAKTSFTFPSGDKTWRMKTWPLPDGEWKIVLFGDNTYNNPVSECLFEVGVEGAEMPAAPTEYYVKFGGTGDGRSESTPAGAIPSVISSINADGWTTGDEVTVYVIDSGEASLEVINSNVVLGYDPQGQGATPEHTATIKWTSYDPDTVTSIIGHTGYLSWNSNSAHLQIKGPSIFEDINIVDMRFSQHGGTDIYLNHYPVEFHNVKFGDLRGTNETQYTTGTVFYPSSTHFAMGMIRGRKTVNLDQYVYIDNADIIGEYVNVTGYNDTAANQGTTGDVTLEIGAGTLKNLNISGSNAVETEVIGGDLTIILGEGVTVKNIGTGSVPAVGGVFNLIQNYGATIPAGYTATPWASTAKTEKAPYYNVVAGAESLAINTTETAGTFEVDTDALAYAVAADGKTVYYGEDEISLVPGTWTILSAESVDAIVETLEDPTVTVDKVFKGWDTSVDGIITPIIEDAPVHADPIYYVQANATGNGLSVDSPVATIKAAIDLINAAGYDADDTVTIYVLNGEKPEGAEREFYFYDKEGNDIYNKSMKPVDGKYYYGRITAFMPDQGGTLPTHNCTINVKAYDTSVTTYLAYGEVLGNNGNVCLTGDFIFDDITIVACRMYDREFFTGGRNVTFNNCGFAYENCGIYEGDGFTALVTGNERVMLDSVGAGTRPGGNVVINSVMTNQTDPRYGLDISGTKGSTFQNEVNVTINHEDFKGQIVWGDAASTFSNGLNIAIENGDVKNVNKGKTITINGGFQVLVNDGGSMTEMATNIAADKTWIVTTEGADLAFTETDGTFAIKDGAYIYSVSEDKKTINYYTGTITLAEGTHALTGAESLEAIIEAAETPEIPEGYVFKGWDDSVAGVLTAKIVEKAKPVYYVKWNGKGNGLSPESPVATVKDAVALINAAGYGADITATIYVMNDDTLTEEQTAGKDSADFWHYDANGNYLTKSTGKTDTPSRFTAWVNGNGGNPGAHAATIVVKGYTEDAMLAYTSIIGGTGSLELGGNTIFEDITLVATRFCDNRIRTLGNNVTYNNVTFKYHNACNYSGGGDLNIIDGHYRLATSNGNNQTRVGHTITFNTDFAPVNGDTRYGVLITDEYTTTFSGHLKYYFNTSSENIFISWGNNSAKFNDGLSIVVNGGTYKQNNHKANVTTVTGGLQVVNNNGASFGTVPANLVTADATWYMNSADKNGNALDVTDTAGTFTVVGGKVAYATDSAYPKTVYYSVDGLLTVPAGTYTVNYADTLVDIKAAVTPFEDASMKFKGWIDDGAGKLTADYTLTGEAVVYYVQHGATGNGLTLETPGSFETVVAAINEKYGAGDEVTIKIVRCASDDNAVIADATAEQITALSFPTLSSIPAHTAMLVLESADLEKRSIVSYANGFTTANDGGGNVELGGPITVKNIDVVDSRLNWFWDTYLNAHDFKIDEGAVFYRPAKSGSTYKVLGQPYNGGFGGGSRSTKTYNTSAVVEFADNTFSSFSYFNFTGYNTTGVMTFNKDMTMKFGAGKAANITLDNMNGTYGLFKKNVNLVLNGTEANGFINRSGKTEAQMPVVQGAIQVIKNGGATINNMSAYAYTTTDRTAKTPVYDLTVIGAAELDVTEIAGKYTVPAGVVAIAVDAEGNRYVSSNNMLTVPGAGVYTVYTDYVVENNVIDFYNTVTLDVAALEVTEAADEIFLGWVLADGTAPKAEETEFKAGDKLSAKFMEFDVENAEGTAGDFFIKGAQIRLEAPAGLRYVVEMDNEFYAELTQYSAELVEAEKPHFGTYIIPADLYDSTEHAEVPAYKLYDETETDTLYTVCLINIKEGSYDRDYTVYGYIDYIDANGVIHTLTTKDYSTSIYDVAKVAVSKGETSEFLTTIIAAVEAE